MLELNTLLKPLWSPEQWISQAWHSITHKEQEHINARVQDLFKNGLPLELHCDKLIYLCVFSMLAQAQALSLGTTMQCENALHQPELKNKLRIQLVNDIVHAIVFTKIVYLLTAPFSLPPTDTKQFEELHNLIRQQKCFKLSTVLYTMLNACIYELLLVFSQENIGKDLFELIIKDKNCQISAAELYAQIGLPHPESTENMLINTAKLISRAASLEPKYPLAMHALLGNHALTRFIKALQKSLTTQYQLLGIKPKDKWDLFFQVGVDLLQQLKQPEIFELAMTPNQKILMTQMNSPDEAKLVLQFTIDISSFRFFEKKYSDEMLTALMMQALSMVISSQPALRTFLSHHNLRQMPDAFLTIIEKVPDCMNHFGTIQFHNCHELTTQELMSRINRAKYLMSYCYKKREQLEKDHPELKNQVDQSLYHYAHNEYSYPITGNHSIFLSNLGSYGYSQANLPLLKQSNFNCVLLAIERKPVWNSATQSFETKDVLPISISTDSRIFDGHLDLPKLLHEAFETVLHNMQNTIEDPSLINYQRKIQQLADDLITDSSIRTNIVKQLIQKAVLKKAGKILGQELQEYHETLNTNFKNLADMLLRDYLQFDANEDIKKTFIDKLVSEHLELSYPLLVVLQQGLIDHQDFAEVEKIIANATLKKLTDSIPKIVRKRAFNL